MLIVAKLLKNGVKTSVDRKSKGNGDGFRNGH